MTNENTEIDVEWMKRGGALRSDGGKILFFAEGWHPSGKVYTYEQNGCNRPSVRRIRLVAKHNLRMATREECAAAGIEYIERPVSAEELAELRKDKERLEFVFESGLSIKHSESGYWFSNAGIVYACDICPNPREAIDAVMKGGE